jgi:hypothetical protein
MVINEETLSRERHFKLNLNEAYCFVRKKGRYSLKDLEDDGGNIEIYNKGLFHEDVEWIQLDKDRLKLLDFGNTL